MVFKNKLASDFTGRFCFLIISSEMALKYLKAGAGAEVKSLTDFLGAGAIFYTLAAVEPER